MGFCDLGGFIIPLNPKIIVLKAAEYTACLSNPRATYFGRQAAWGIWRHV